MQGWVTAFSNAKVSEPTYIDAGDTVVAQFNLLPATKKPVNFHACEIFRFNDKGQIVSGVIYYDQLSIMVQLGHAQAAAAG